jgi:hypothetical protein
VCSLLLIALHILFNCLLFHCFQFRINCDKQLVGVYLGSFRFDEEKMRDEVLEAEMWHL